MVDKVDLTGFSVVPVSGDSISTVLVLARIELLGLMAYSKSAIGNRSKKPCKGYINCLKEVLDAHVRLTSSLLPALVAVLLFENLGAHGWVCPVNRFLNLQEVVAR